MSVLQGIVNNALPSTIFSFQGNTFVAEASDLKGHELYQQIYDDACDVGFGIKSDRTGEVVKFYLHEENRDSDNYIRYWIFLPCPEDSRNPRIAKLRVKVYND